MAQSSVEDPLRQQPQQPHLPSAAASNPWPPAKAPLPPQQSVAAQPFPLLSSPEEVGGDEHEEVVVSKNMVVEVGRVMARDGGNGMVRYMQMNNRKELIQQQPQQQQPHLPGAAAPDPWPPPLSADLDESNSNEREIRRHDFLVFVLGGRATAGSVAFGK